LAVENQTTVNIGDLPTVGMHESHRVQIFQNLIGNAIEYRDTREPLVSAS